MASDPRCLAMDSTAVQQHVLFMSPILLAQGILLCRLVQHAIMPAAYCCGARLVENFWFLDEYCTAYYIVVYY